jgi:hypothetical protein
MIIAFQHVIPIAANAKRLTNPLIAAIVAGWSDRYGLLGDGTD